MLSRVKTKGKRMAGLTALTTEVRGAGQGERCGALLLGGIWHD